jgi:RHS repeat-associated protein
MSTPSLQRRWKNLPGEPVGDAGDPYTGYDRFGRTEQMRWIKPHTGDSGFDTLVNVQWGYNRASQKTWRKDLLAPSSTGQDQHFGYDGLYQVTERQRGLLNVNTTAVGGVPAQQENFSYDETGNWITYKQSNEGALGIDQSRVNNRSNQMTQVDGSSAGISYDANGNMLTVPTGDGLTGPSRKLVWDAWNRLRKVSDEEGNVIAEYQYDGTMRRTKVESGGVTKHCYYDDQWRTVEERLDASTTPVTQHVWHPTDRWELLFRDRSTANNGTLDERLYSLKDQLDPVAICDTSGSVVERYEYTAFGMPTFLNEDFTPKEGNVSIFDWNFLFHAEFADTETGWFNYGYRYYVPTLGRWLSRDPIGIAGGMNLYLMDGNYPMDTQDWLGLAPPKFEPKKWPKNSDTFNEDGDPIRQLNCYNYACNRPDGPGIPGTKGRKRLDVDDFIDCDKLLAALEADGWKYPLDPLDRHEVSRPCCPRNYHLVTIHLDPNENDIHFYREDADGGWSHYRRGFGASRTDAAGHKLKGRPVVTTIGPANNTEREPWDEDVSHDYGDYNYNVFCGTMCAQD